MCWFKKKKSRWYKNATQVTRFAVVREAPDPSKKGDPNILRSKNSKVGKSRYS